jgi:lipid-A-disaccharide synthase
MPIFESTIASLSKEVRNLKVAVPIVPNVAALVRSEAQNWTNPVILVEQPEERRNLFAASDLALAKSGTSAVELAAARVPTVITQKLSYLSVLIFVMLAKVRFVSIINLMANEELQLERLQRRCTPKALAKALMELLANREATALRVAKGYQMAAELGAEGTPPSVKAANAILAFLSSRINSANAAALAGPDYGKDDSRVRPQDIHA